MTHVWAVILGVIQGLAEFLPISSSAHLALIQQFKPLHVPALVASTQFDIALHLGSALAILIVLWRDWTSLVTGAIKENGFQRKLVGFLLLTSIPGAIFGVLLDEKAAAAIHNPLVIAGTLMAMGVVLWLVDTSVKRQEPIEDMTWLRSLGIGVAQAIAIIPGVSRSGVTITAGRGLGFSREAIAKYSFMAAFPIILGAGAWGLRKEHLATLFSLDWALGFLAAFVFSMIAMRFMLDYLRKHSFLVFAVYRLALGAVVILLFVLGLFT
jgi:undecaprenyl-diphosphatase